MAKMSVSKLREESVISLPLLALTDQSTSRGESEGLQRFSSDDSFRGSFFHVFNIT